MNITEKNAEAVIEALIEQIRTLKTEIWFRDSRITELKAEVEKLKGGKANG